MLGLTVSEIDSDFEKFDYQFYCGIKEGAGVSLEEFNNLPVDTFVLDVRESWEKPQVENGKVLNAPLDDLDDYINEIPQEIPVYVVCQKGGRSQAAIDYLEKEYKKCIYGWGY